MRILTPNQKKYRKKLITMSLLFSVIFPILLTVLFNGGEHIVYYKSAVAENIFGIVMAQVISIVGNILFSGCFIGVVVVLAVTLSCFSGKNSAPVVAFSFLYPIISQIISFVTLFFIVIAGFHDDYYSLSKLKSELSVIFDVAVISAFINLLVILACFMLFYFSSGINEKGIRKNRYFKRGILYVFAAVSGIKVVSFVIDLIFETYPKVMGINEVMSYFILPIIYIAMEIVFSYFVLKYLIIYLDKYFLEYEVGVTPVLANKNDKKIRRANKKAEIKKKVSEKSERRANEKK